jgi:uncharacterized protein YkwD
MSLRRLTLLVLLLTLTVGSLTVSIPISAETRLDVATAINRLHFEAGHPWLAGDWTLDLYAQAHAEQLAAVGYLYHSDINRLIGTWTAVGEIVGVGSTTPTVVEAFRNSPSHLEIIAAPYTYVGVGVAWNGRLWIVVVFAK